MLRVNAVHRDAAFTKTVGAAVDREIGDLARWLELDLVRPGYSLDGRAMSYGLPAKQQPVN